MDKSIELTLGTLEQEMKLKSNTLVSVFKDDDWSFVIKANALIESFFYYLITYHEDEDAIREVWKRRDKNDYIKLSDLIKIATNYKYIDKDLTDFLQRFSKLRNRLAHNIRYLGFCFEDDVPKELEEALFESFKRIDFKVFDDAAELNKLYQLAISDSPDAERHPMYYQVFAAVTAMIYTIHKAECVERSVSSAKWEHHKGSIRT